MDTLNQQSNAPEQSEAPAVPAAVSVNQPAKPEPHVSDADAQALLMTSNIQTMHRQKSKRPTMLLITALTLIVLVIAASYALGSLKHGSNSSNSTGGANQSTSTNSQTQSVTNQVNQDVKSCSNLSTAVSQC